MSERSRVLGPRQSGISLLSVLVAVAITGIVMVAVFQMLSNHMNTQKHLEYRDELRHLRNQITERLSCTQSLPVASLTNCLTALDPTGTLANPPYAQLLDKAGKPMGKLLADGSSAIGKWRFRGRCVRSATTNALQIAVARFDAKGAIAQDPLNGKPLGWMPLFDADSPLGTTLCMDEISGGGDDVEAPHIQSGIMEASSASGCGDGLLASLFGSSSKVFKATVNCPSDSIALGGGAECMVGAGRRNLVTAIAGSPKGLMIANRPASNGKGWYVECCLKTGGVLFGLIGGGFPAPKAYVTCVKKD